MTIVSVRRAILACILLITPVAPSYSATLFTRGKTAYTIVVATDASLTEKTAAQELKEYLTKISNADFRITNDLDSHTGKHIYVGYNRRVAFLTKCAKPNDDDEAFCYKNVGDDIVIYGGRKRGTMYGVFTFLSKELGVRWYASDYTKIPTRDTWSFKTLQHTDKPAIKFRQDYYYDCYRNPEWAAHNRCNMATPQHSKYGYMELISPCHSLPLLISQDEFFDKHPEYFAMRDGKRNGKAQLCLSNPNVLDTVIARLTQYIEKHPAFTVYDVSQADNSLYCECQACKAIEAQYGGQHSGIMLWFVNKVAEGIEKVYPDKQLCTFAYRYTRQAPIGIRARHNVIVRLCSIECCFAHPLASCPKNNDFIKDLNDWNKVTDKLFIWDYVIGFWQYLAPFPNFLVLAPNLQLFQKHGAIAVLEQGQRESRGGEFYELRTWILAQLLWNPQQDTDRLVKEFIKDYYGPAARHIQKYYDKCQKQVKPDTHFDIHLLHDDKLYSDEFVTSSAQLLHKARQTCNGNSIYIDRVDRIRMQIMYLQCCRTPQQAKQNGIYNELLTLIRRYKTHVREWHNEDEFVQKMESL